MAQYKTFVQLLEEGAKVNQDLEIAILNYNREPHPYTKAHIEQLQRKLEWYADEIERFGKGKIIEITGLVKVQNKRNPTLTTSKPFKYYMIHCSVEDAHLYFKNIVNKKYSIDIERTLSIKELKTGILITS